MKTGHRWLPDAEQLQRNPWLLVWIVVTPYWLFMLTTRTLGFNLATALDPRIIIAPPQLRVLQHLLLLPLLVLFLRTALLIGLRPSQRWRALLVHGGMALLFALIARPILVVLVAMQRGDVSLLDELFRSMIGPGFSLVLWSSSGADFLLSYAGALVLVFAAHYTLHLHHRLQRAAAMESEWVRGRLQSLQQRAHPQFVINALQHAAAAIPHSPAVAADLLGRLAALLRRSVALNGDDLVPVTDEVESARQYLEIQRLRFADLVGYTLDIEPEARASLMPAMTLQPLIEDVLLRSFRGSVGQLSVRVRVHRVAAGIDVQVTTDARSIGQTCDQPTLAESASVAATRERLRRFFGEHQGLDLDERGDQRISAHLHMPWVPVTGMAA